MVEFNLLNKLIKGFRMKKLALIGMLSTIVASSLMAETVTKAADGLGDFLIAPYYQAKSNVCSEIRVTNTNEKASILAKVAFREQISSQEVDLPIFLSPGDVWSGTVCQNNGEVILKSNDDSNHPAARAILKVGKNLERQSIKAGHKNVDFTSGYVEVYPIAEFKENTKTKIEKSKLVKRWDNLINGNTNLPNLRTNGVDGNSLTGEVLFKNGYNAPVTATEKMVAFKGTHEKQLSGSIINYGNDTAPDILLGIDKKQELLKIMQHSTAAFTYDNRGEDQYIVFTYPFTYKEDQVRRYKVVVRDMEENKDVKQEIVIFSPAPVKKSKTMLNEVAVLSVSDIIAQTSNPKAFKKGQIQIQDITNMTDEQLGSNKNASFIATYIRIGTDLKGQQVVVDTENVITKK